MRRIKAFFSSPLCLIWIAPFVLMSPVLVPGKAMFWGTPMLQFVPWWTQASRILAQGQLPLWNPLVGMGAPLLANYQSALLYPPTWTYLLLGFTGGAPAIARGLGFVAAVHFGWGGWGMAKLIRRLGWGQLAQTVSGLA
ncbi:MAG: hypothetical protein OEY93_10180, partial [Anaerolineae bacterium]|nr:hypothetical protein [Anaerolineae bacterium]